MIKKNIKNTALYDLKIIKNTDPYDLIKTKYKENQIT